MNVVIVLGSRSRQGQTAAAAGALAEGLTEGGATVQWFCLPTLRLERCRQCDEAGWGSCRTDGRCVIADDLESVLAALATADLAVFATPVYFASLAESLRALLDRARRLSIHAGAKQRLAGRRAVGVCVAGGGGGGAYACSDELDRVLRTIGLDVVDVVPVRRQNLAAKREILRLTGRHLAATQPK